MHRCGQHALPLLRALLLCALAQPLMAGKAQLDREDPTLRRFLLLIVAPATCVLLYYTIRSYFPDMSLREVVAEVKQSGKETTQRLRPKWWEGGNLGGDSSIKNVGLPRKFRPPHPTRKPAHSSVRILQESGRDDEEAGLWAEANEPYPDPENPPEPPPRLAPHPLHRSAESPVRPPVKSMEELTAGLVNNEELKRSSIAAVCAEEMFSFARERDLDRKRVLLTERRRLGEEEYAVRRDIIALESEVYSATMLRMWSDISERSVMEENEVDTRYTILSEEAAERRSLASYEAEGRVLAATVEARHDLSHEETEERDHIDVMQEVGYAKILSGSARSFFSATEETARQYGRMAEVSQRCGIYLGAAECHESVERALVCQWEAVSGVDLSEVSGRLHLSAEEGYKQRHLRELECDERRRINVVLMEVVIEGAVVRETANRHSKQVGSLERGVVVEVEEITRGGRARLTNPPGWVSVRSQAGMEVLRRLGDATPPATPPPQEVAPPPPAPPVPPATPPRTPVRGGPDGDSSEPATPVHAAPVPRSPATSLASSASNMLEDFREVVMHKAPEQKLGICFAPASRLVLSGCTEGSAAHTSGLDEVLGHRLIKVNNVAVKDKASIAPFAKEELLHLVFSKNPDRGWDPKTQTWVPPMLSTDVVDDVATAALSGAMSGFRSLRKATDKLRESSAVKALAVKKAE